MMLAHGSVELVLGKDLMNHLMDFTKTPNVIIEHISTTM